MNEGLAVFLDLDERERKENRALIKRIDALLLEYGIKYSGIRNLYIPIDGKGRDQTVFDACRALREADWLKGRLVCIPIMQRTNACSIEEICVENMAEPAAEKLEYYEQYYQETHKLAHGIIVDEDKRLRDGYISYLLAKKYGVRPDIYEALAGQPLRKLISGQHVARSGDTWKVGSTKVYHWNYAIKDPVVPGDILLVEAKKGFAYIRVEEIAYTTGEAFCMEHRSVIKHMKERMNFED